MLWVMHSRPELVEGCEHSLYKKITLNTKKAPEFQGLLNKLVLLD